MKTLSILIPVYNEENTIRRVIDAVQSVVLPSVAKEIIVVDDGSSDQTAKVLEKTDGITFIRHPENQGKGAAIRTAIKQCTGDVVIIQDADMEYDPNDYPLLIEPILQGACKVVYGSRRLKKSNKQHSALSFFLGGVGLTMLTNLLYPGARITDEPTCYKTFDGDLLRSIPLRCTGFEFCPEVTAKVLKRGQRIVEVPISYFPRHISEGKKIKWRDGVIAIWTLIRFRFTD
jgi:glycosyltransferase involved in cell wall biosynthesis